MQNQFKKNLKIIKNKQNMKILKQLKNWKFHLISLKVFFRNKLN